MLVTNLDIHSMDLELVYVTSTNRVEVVEAGVYLQSI